MTETVDNKPTILVVDDSRLMRVAARKILKNDFDILEAADGEQAWTSLQENSHIILVMSDLSMPNLDGLGLLKRIRESESEELKCLPVIIVTGAEDDDGVHTSQRRQDPRPVSGPHDRATAALEAPNTGVRVDGDE